MSYRLVVVGTWGISQATLLRCIHLCATLLLIQRQYSKSQGAYRVCCALYVHLRQSPIGAAELRAATNVDDMYRPSLSNGADLRLSARQRKNGREY